MVLEITWSFSYLQIRHLNEYCLVKGTSEALVCVALRGHHHPKPGCIYSWIFPQDAYYVGYGGAHKQTVHTLKYQFIL